MLKNIYRLLTVLAVPSLLLLYSYNGGSPGGKTASPGDMGATCTDCHYSSVTEHSGWITTNIPENGFTPGETYQITATGTHENVVKFGFELTAEDENGEKTGTLAVTDAERTKFTNANNAITHTAAGNQPEGGMNSWTMNWTAPEVIEGNVWFFAAFNAANGNGNTGGDVIYTSSLSVDQFVPVPVIAFVDPDHAEQGWMGQLAVTGENTNWEGEGVTSIIFKFHSNPFEKFEGTNIEVLSDTELVCDVSIPEDKSIGLYDVFVDAIKLDDGFTVDIISSVGDNLLAKQVLTYPNPTMDFINVNLPEHSSLRMVDMMGRLVFAKENSGAQEYINLSGLEKGYYFLQVISAGETTTRRILKN